MQDFEDRARQTGTVGQSGLSDGKALLYHLSPQQSTQLGFPQELAQAS